jgi:hypothetical protein
MVVSMVATLFADDFAALLLPNGQFGVAVSRGINFMFHLDTAQFDIFISKPLQTGKAPTHVLLLLDIINMFIQMSRDAACDALASKPALQSILPYFDIMYSNANYCYFTRPDATLDYFSQGEEGKRNSLFYRLDQIWVHLLVSQIPTGGSTNVGREYANVVHFCHMFHICTSDKRNDCYFLVLLQTTLSSNCLDQIWVDGEVLSIMFLAVAGRSQNDNLH